MSSTSRLPLFALVLIALASCQERKHWIIESEIGRLRLEQITDSVTMPFAMVFVSKNQILLGDRPLGVMYLVDTYNGGKTPVRGTPQVYGQGDSGLLDIQLAPDFEESHRIYFDYTLQDSSGFSLAVETAILEEDSLLNRKRLFTARPYFPEQSFYGSRLLIDGEYVFITTGVDYTKQDSSQSLSNHLGKIMRIKTDGSIPQDNPFIGVPGALPEIWCYGTRNPQGLALHPQTGEMWENEHGPKGGDEVNIIKKGLNYGWPVISHGIDYDDKPIGEGLREKEGMEQPMHFYVPSIAPSGLVFYTGDRYPEWKDNLFIGGMKLTHLNRLVLEGNKVVHEERIMTDLKWRVRNVVQGPDGYLYVTTDAGMEPGRVLRILPE